MSTKELTADGFLARHDWRDYEIVGGDLISWRRHGAMHRFLTVQIACALHRGSYDVGFVFSSGAPCCCFETQYDCRRSSVSFIAHGRLPSDEIPQGYITIPPDLAVEVISPNDTAYEVVAKVEQYLTNGVEEVWAVYPNTRSVNVHRLGAPIQHLSGDDVLRGNGVLSVFSSPVSAFFPPASA